MPIVKVIEVIASSEISFDDAVKNCLAEVSKTVHNIDSIYVKDFKVHVRIESLLRTALYARFLSVLIPNSVSLTFF